MPGTVLGAGNWGIGGAVLHGDRTANAHDKSAWK